MDTPDWAILPHTWDGFEEAADMIGESLEDDTSITLVVLHSGYGTYPMDPRDDGFEDLVEEYREPYDGYGDDEGSLATGVPGQELPRSSQEMVPYCRRAGGLFRIERDNSDRWAFKKGSLSDWDGLFPCCNWLLRAQRSKYREDNVQ